MLTKRQVSDFYQRGFLSVETITTLKDVQDIREILDGLFARFNDLPENIALDLGDERSHKGPPQIPEINRAIDLEPRLKETLAFRRCRDIAGQLLGRKARYCYDHSIYKPPYNQRETPWHQDQAYDAGKSQTVLTFWLALQDVTVENGCMQYIPYSHERGLRAHHKRGHRHTAHALTVDDVDATQAVACPLRTGGITIHLPQTLHYTGPNNTGALRRSWILLFEESPRSAWSTVHLHPVPLLAKLKTYFT